MSPLLKSIENIYAQRSLIVKELERWSFSTDEKSRIDKLIFNLQNNVCKQNDIETILFQIECFNKNEAPLRVDLNISVNEVSKPNMVQMYGVWNFYIFEADGSGEDFLYSTFEGAMNYCNDSDNWLKGTYPLCICKVDVERDKITLSSNGSYSFEYIKKQYWQLVFDDC